MTFPQCQCLYYVKIVWHMKHTGHNVHTFVPDWRIFHFMYVFTCDLGRNREGIHTTKISCILDDHVYIFQDMNATVIFSSLCSSIWYIIWHTNHFKRGRNQWISSTSIINTTAGAQFVFWCPGAQSYISTDVVPNQRGPVVHILGAQLAKGPSQADPIAHYCKPVKVRYPLSLLISLMPLIRKH